MRCRREVHCPGMRVIVEGAQNFAPAVWSGRLRMEVATPAKDEVSSVSACRRAKVGKDRLGSK